MSKIAEKINQYKYSFAIWTDRTDFITDKTAPLNEDKLLEIRCFDESGEYRAYRSVVDKDYAEREIKTFDGFFDEFQYLDIDSERSNGAEKHTIGGGIYHLPEDAKNKAGLNVRYYYKFDDNNGVARIVDWRLVNFCNKEG